MCAQRPAPYQLTVLTGPNAGAEITFSETRLSIGDGDSDDIRLDGLDGTTLRVALKDETLRVRPGAGQTVSADEATDCVAEKVTTLGLPARLQVSDETALYFCRRGSSVPAWRRLPALTGAGLLACALGLLATTQVDLGPAANARAPERADGGRDPAPVPAWLAAVTLTKADTLEPEAAGTTTSGAAASAEAEPVTTPAADDLRRRAAEAGLARLAVAIDGDVLRVTGARAPGTDAAWRTVRQEFEQRWGQRVPLVIEVATTETEAPFAVASVWLGTEPELRTREGARYRVGSRTADDWRVEAIESGRVTLSRDGSTIRIAF